MAVNQIKHKDAVPAVCDVVDAAGTIISSTGCIGIGTFFGSGQAIIKAVAQLSPLVHNEGQAHVDLKKALVYDAKSGKINLQTFVKAISGALKIAKLAKAFGNYVPVIGIVCTTLKGVQVVIGIVEIFINRKKLRSEISGIKGALKLVFSITHPVIASCVCTMCGPILSVPICAALFLVRGTWSGKNFESTALASGDLYGLVGDVMGRDPIASLPWMQKAAKVAYDVSKKWNLIPGIISNDKDPNPAEAVRKVAVKAFGVTKDVMMALTSCCGCVHVSFPGECVKCIKAVANDVAGAFSTENRESSLENDDAYDGFVIPMGDYDEFIRKSAYRAPSA